MVIVGGGTYHKQGIDNHSHAFPLEIWGQCTHATEFLKIKSIVNEVMRLQDQSVPVPVTSFWIAECVCDRSTSLQLGCVAIERQKRS